jgi:hypothetical protein
VAQGIAWAARFVGVNIPELILIPEFFSDVELAIGDRQRLLIAGHLWGSLQPAELAFLGARQLSILRPELIWRGAFTTPADVAAAIGLCVRFAHQGSDLLISADASEERLADQFVLQLQANRTLKERVTQVFRACDANGAAWQELALRCLRAADRALVRTGLIACGNPAIAWKLTEKWPLISILTVEEQLDEVASFAVSPGHLALRKSLGLAVASTFGTHSSRG